MCSPPDTGARIFASGVFPGQLRCTAQKCACEERGHLHLSGMSAAAMVVTLLRPTPAAASGERGITSRLMTTLTPTGFGAFARYLSPRFESPLGA